MVSAARLSSAASHLHFAHKNCSHALISKRLLLIDIEEHKADFLIPPFFSVF